MLDSVSTHRPPDATLMNNASTRRRALSLIVVFGAAAQLAACNYCGAEEEFAVTVSSVDSLTFTWSDRTLRQQTGGRVTDRETTPAGFRALHDALEGRPHGVNGVAITLSERDPATNQMVTLSIAVPAELRRGARYPVGGTYALPPGEMHGPIAWGSRTLGSPGHAEVGFNTSSYSFPPPVHTYIYLATGATGWVEVVERGRGWMHLQLSLDFTDADGRVVRVTGRVQAQAERYTPPCT